VIGNTRNRIQSISLVHQMLYKNRDLSRISIREYIHELAGLIFQSFGITKDRILLNDNIDDQSLLLDTALPFGLILNELITNSLKYAFPDNRKGIIDITLIREGPDKNILRYSDNGIGVPSAFDFRNHKNFGFNLVYGIGESQMMGKILMESNNGFTCTFEFPTNLYNARV